MNSRRPHRSELSGQNKPTPLKPIQSVMAAFYLRKHLFFVNSIPTLA
jgi:hypothetical protein